MTKPEFSLIIPCYNEEGAIRDTLESIFTDLGSDKNYEVIVVNDGSTDRSGEILAAAQADFDKLKVFSNDPNRGYGAALKSGINRAKAELIVITDADGTYPNHRIGELVDECRSRELDMLVGARIGADVTYSKIRAVPKIFLRAWASWVAGQNIPDINSGLRVFRRDAAKRFLGILPDTFSFTTTITLAMMTNYMPVGYTPISYQARIGKSKIKPIRDTIRFCMLILRTGMYFAPARALFPVIVAMTVATIASLARDITLENLTDTTVILALFTMNSGMFALLADMIDKRSAR